MSGSEGPLGGSEGRRRHARRRTTLRVCSGANPFDGLEASGRMNDDTKPAGMMKSRGQNNGRMAVHYREREGDIVYELGGQSKVDEGNFKRTAK